MNNHFKKSLYWILAIALMGAIAQPILADDAKEDDAKSDPRATEYQPEAIEVLERSVKAIGGKEALRKHEHRTLKGKLAITGAGLSGDMTMYASAPHHLLIVVNLEGVGEIRSGYNGKVGWTIDAMQGPMLLEDATLVQLSRQADFYSALNYKKHYKKIEHLGREEFNGKQAYKLRAVDQSDNESFLYFDVESYLAIGHKAEMETMMGSVPTTTVLSDYREFGGVKYPAVTDMSMLQLGQRITVESITYDAIPMSTYELPIEIKALLPEDEDDEGEKPTDD